MYKFVHHEGRTVLVRISDMDEIISMLLLVWDYWTNGLNRTYKDKAYIV